MTDDDRPDLPAPLAGASEAKDFLLIDRILREVHTMRVETARRRFRRRRVALAASLLLPLAGAGAYGYLAMSITKPADGQANREAPANPGPKIVEASDDRPGPIREAHEPKAVASAAKGSVIPVAPSLYSMHLNERDIPLYSADEPGASPSRRHYVYSAPVRVAEAPRFDPKSNQVAITLDMTAPEGARAEASRNVADALSGNGSPRPKVIVQPLSIRSYAVQLIAEKAEGAFEIGSAGDRTTAVLPSEMLTFNAVVPESMPILREKLRASPGDVRVQFRAVYDFERVVKGSVSLARADNAIHRVLDEVRPKFPDGKVPPELYVDRQARDFVQVRLGDSIQSNEINSGLSDEAFAAFVVDARASVKEYFATLPRRDPYQLITRDTNEVALIFTAPTGQIDSKAILSRDKITFKEKSEEYARKASEALKIVQDVARKSTFSHETYKEMREKLSLDAKLSLAIGMFKGSAALKLDKSSDQITQDDLKTMNDNRDYWTSDATKTEDISSKVQEKVAGDMNLEKSIAKTLDYYRLDERELASRVEAAFTRTVSQGFEGLGLLSETNLVVRPLALASAPAADLSALDDGYQELQGRVGAMEARCKAAEDEAGALKDALKHRPRYGFATHKLLISGSPATAQTLKNNLTPGDYELAQKFTFLGSEGWTSESLRDPKTNNQLRFGKRVVSVSYSVENFNWEFSHWNTPFKLAVNDNNLVGFGSLPPSSVAPGLMPGGGLLVISVVYEE